MGEEPPVKESCWSFRKSSGWLRGRQAERGAGRGSLWTKEDGQLSSGVICQGGKISDTSGDFPAQSVKLIGEWQMMTAIHVVSSLVLPLHPY